MHSILVLVIVFWTNGAVVNADVQLLPTEQDMCAVVGQSIQKDWEKTKGNTLSWSCQVAVSKDASV